MTRKERKEFLQAIGFWKDFLTIREKLGQEGLSHVDASEEALRQIRDFPIQTSGTPKEREQWVDGTWWKHDDPWLIDMAWVIEQKPGCDRTELQRRLRIWLDNDIGGFMSWHMKLYYREQDKRRADEEKGAKKRDKDGDEYERSRFAGLRKIQQKFMTKG